MSIQHVELLFLNLEFINKLFLLQLVEDELCRRRQLPEGYFIPGKFDFSFKLIYENKQLMMFGIIVIKLLL